ncbi:MAG: SRPBCC domain-containing protein [Acidobacteria bacterium]|nr:SRPBCC domain-containing protein [Acidobacteriota bacterium]
MSHEKTAVDTRSLERQIEINAPAEAVWKALTDAEEITRWFPPEARVEPGAGGSLLWWWAEDIQWPSQIEIWEPNKHLRASYTKPPARDLAPPGPMVMDFHLEARGGKTVLRIVHSGFSAGAGWDDEYDGVGRGWTMEFRSLRHYMENHRGTPRRVAWSWVPLSVSYEEAWRRLMSPLGLLRQGTLDGLREGDRYALTAATGDQLAGEVLTYLPPHAFSGTVEGMNNALFFVLIDKCRGPEVWAWLATYGVPQAEVNAFRDRWSRLLANLFSTG